MASQTREYRERGAGEKEQGKIELYNEVTQTFFYCCSAPIMAEGSTTSEVILIFLLLANGISQVRVWNTLIFDKNVVNKLNTANEPKQNDSNLRNKTKQQHQWASELFLHKSWKLLPLPFGLTWLKE